MVALTPRQKDGIFCLLLFAVAYLIYSNTFGNGWTYDDFPVIVDNPDIRSWAGFLKNDYPGRPVRELTYLLDFSLFGAQPAGWHLQQIFWHALNACLLFLLGRRLDMPAWPALVAALLFTLHPLQVEVVANLSHRKDSLALAGSLGTILCYMQFLKVQERRMLWLLGSFACFGFALFSKQTTVLLPLVLAGYEWLLLPCEKRVLMRSPKIVFGMISAACIAAVVWFVASGTSKTLFLSMADTLAFKANYFEPVTVTTYYLNVVKSWVFLASRIVWPTNLALEYTFPVVTGMFDLWVVTGLALAALIIGLCLYWVRKWPVGAWMTATAVLLFLPTSNLWPLVYLAADRYLYAPLAFLFLLTGFAVARLLKFKSVTVVVSVTVLVVLGGLTWQQNRVWASPESLWLQASRVSPGSSFALNNLGNISLAERDFGAARSYYERAVRVNHLNPTAHFNLGMLAEQRGELQQAMIHYRAFARLNHPVYRKQLQALEERLLRTYRIRL